MARNQVADGCDMEGSSRGQLKRGGPPAWGLEEVLTTSDREQLIMLRNIKQKSQNQTGPSVRPKQWKRNMRLGTWNVRSLYRSGSLTKWILERLDGGYGVD